MPQVARWRAQRLCSCTAVQWNYASVTVSQPLLQRIVSQKCPRAENEGQSILKASTQPNTIVEPR